MYAHIMDSNSLSIASTSNDKEVKYRVYIFQTQIHNKRSSLTLAAYRVLASTIQPSM